MEKIGPRQGPKQSGAHIKSFVLRCVHIGDGDAQGIRTITRLRFSQFLQFAVTSFANSGAQSVELQKYQTLLDR